ncbi:hypothetical protein ABZ135_19595 [Streptomyces sp. NPDC006339]|uniref:hypothetical protein n=1 Tax=Streptomyces sp. NPDC006339 TaxID=3156755 RepID=UPI0033A2C77F
MERTTAPAPLPRGTRVLTIGLHPRALDYSRMPEGLDEAAMAARIEAGHALVREAGFDAVSCLIDGDPDGAERAVRAHLRDREFGLAMIGGGVRMLPEHTLLFERIVDVLGEAEPRIRLCFNTSPEGVVDALKRWVSG